MVAADGALSRAKGKDVSEQDRPEDVAANHAAHPLTHVVNDDVPAPKADSVPLRRREACIKSASVSHLLSLQHSLLCRHLTFLT